MSNPGVQILAESKKGHFRIEDNIGEAIHIHYKNFRVDLTIQEFNEISNALIDVVNELLNIYNFDISQIEAKFLLLLAPNLFNLQQVSYEQKQLSKLKVDTYNSLNLPVYRELRYSRVYKALSGERRENDKRIQINSLGMNNNERLMQNYEYVKTLETIDNMVTVFGENDVIQDGQHRAASYLFIYGDTDIRIKRYIFRKLPYANTCTHPWLPYLFYWPPARIKNLVKRGIKRTKLITRKTKIKFQK